jgi:hypothetical protein
LVKSTDSLSIFYTCILINPYKNRNEGFSQHLDGEEINIEFKLKDSHTFHSNYIGIWTSSLWDLIRPPIVNSLDKWLPLEPEGSGEIHVKIDYDTNK